MSQPTYNRPLSLRRRVRNGLDALLQATGAGRLYVRSRTIRGAVILMYHSVADDAAARGIDPANRLPASVFAAHCRFLAQHRRVISLAELCAAFDRGETPAAGTVVITFDDGYLDNLTVAALLLAEHGLPATLFLPTAYIANGQPQWIDELYTLFTTRTCDTLDAALTNGGVTHLRTAEQAGVAYRQIAGRLLGASMAERATVLAAVRAALRPSASPARTTMNWDDVRTLVRDFPGFTIGAHTRTHADLTVLPPAELEAEVCGAAADITNALGAAPQYFAYPYNRTHAAARAAVRQAGFVAAVADGPEPLLTAQTERLAMPRVEAPASLNRLAFVTSGAYPGLSRLVTGRA